MADGKNTEDPDRLGEGEMRRRRSYVQYAKETLHVLQSFLKFYNGFASSGTTVQLKSLVHKYQPQANPLMHTYLLVIIAIALVDYSSEIKF